MPTADEIRASGRASADALLPGVREEFEKGDKRALLKAIYYCALFEVELPRWAAKAFEAAYRDVVWECRANWNNVFGKPPRKGRQESKAHRCKVEQIYDAVRRLQAKGTATDQGLFEQVALDLHLLEGGATVKKLYYERCAEYRAMRDELEEISKCLSANILNWMNRL